VLGLNARWCLHAPKRPYPWSPVLTSQVPHDRLVAARITVITDQQLVELSDLAGAPPARQPSVPEPLLQRFDNLLVALQRRRLTCPTIRTLRLAQSLESVSHRALAHPELARQLTHRSPSLVHPLRHHHLLLAQLHAASGSRVDPEGDRQMAVPSSQQVRKSGCLLIRSMGASPTSGANLPSSELSFHSQGSRQSDQLLEDTCLS
jgi:hypothetical protein